MSSAPISHLRVQLDPWNGAFAQVWDYSVSHSVLRIKVARQGDEQCILVTLVDCDEVSFSSTWDSFRPNLEIFLGPFGERIRISDGAHLRVQCGGVSVSERYSSYLEIPPISETGW
jgi:hypothetical protein